jgi:hypothetical protein
MVTCEKSTCHCERREAISSRPPGFIARLLRDARNDMIYLIIFLKIIMSERGEMPPFSLPRPPPEGRRAWRSISGVRALPQAKAWG